MLSKAAESKHQNTFHIKFRFDIEVSLFFFYKQNLGLLHPRAAYIYSCP